MKPINHNAYEIIETHNIKELASDAYLLRHKKTGARVALLSNDDENKVFYIAFRTPPTDSTGVAHILEHSVLCGSKNFPVKDPFVELAKSSLNTFLNAMTYPDKTVYPVASCNDTDFQNLMHVYMDAVFYPNIYSQKKIFEQEGWHYELENADEELKYNGVVYNEMKGAFSSPDDVHERSIMNSLFPESPYGVESGGDPDVIPHLTYEQFLEFHGRYYHPSNSYIYLYGNMDMEEKLEWMDREYLSKFEACPVDSEIKLQAGFDAPKDYYLEYPITDDESTTDATYLSFNTVVGNSVDPEIYIAFQVLDYALCSAPGAPLYEALLGQNIGKEVYSIYENGIAQPYFSIVAKQANHKDKTNFVQTIKTVLNDIVTNGMNKKSLKAALNYFEFKYKEADFGNYPKGLMYGLQAMDSWLYDETKPFIHLEANDTFASLKAKAETDYFEKLIKEYLLDNNHVSIVEVSPRQGLTKIKDDKLSTKLEYIKEKMTAEELQEVIDETKALKAYQEAGDTPESLACLPKLRRSDIKKSAEKLVNEMVVIDGAEVLHHDIFTNGIAYIKLLYDIKDVPKRLTGVLGLYKALFGALSTTNYSYGDLFNEINLNTGGIGNNILIMNRNKEYRDVITKFEIRVRTLNENIDKSFELITEVILRSILNDKKRIKEIVGETKSHLQSVFMTAGHSTAMLRANSYFSPSGALVDAVSGLKFYRYIDDLDKNFDNRFEDLVSDLEELVSIIYRPENLMVDFTGDKAQLDRIATNAIMLSGKLALSGMVDYTNEHQTIGNTYNAARKAVNKNEGFTNSAQVQYVCRAGNFRDAGLDYHGALRVLKIMMGYDYLWTNVRVMGGAYGCMSGFGRSGDSFFVSYRDPNLEKTIEIYEKAAEYIRNIELEESELDGYCIGAFSEIDMPTTPMTKGIKNLTAYLTGITDEDIQRERDEALGVTVDDIRHMADYIDAFMKTGAMCTVGNEDKIKDNKELFNTIESIM